MSQSGTFQLHKALAILLSLALILTAVFGGTFAQIITQTPSFINTFLSGLDPTADLLISKTVTHPFGDGYTLPEGMCFTFTVSLGPEFAEKTIHTSQGDMTADANGDITVTAAPDGAVRILDLPPGTSVTVREHPSAGFTPQGGQEHTCVLEPDENRVAYVNVYSPAPVSPVELTVSGIKLLEGRPWQEGDSFTFLLEYKPAGAPDWQTAGTASVAYDPDNPDFNRFSFTELVQGISYSTAGEYAFRVSEIEGTVPGITYDQVVSYFDVTVGDADLDGMLEIQAVKGYQNAVASYDEATGSYHVDVTVSNRYAPAGTAAAVIPIDKQVLSLSGAEKSPAGYTFELFDGEGNLAAVSGETSAAGETAIELTFEAKDAGQTFHYVLKETYGGETHKGLSYDAAEYPIAISVVDNLDGTISAFISDPSEENGNPYRASFVNVYDPADTSAVISGTKELTGRALNKGEFSFDLYETGDSFTVEPEQKPIETVTHDTEGGFAFAAIDYTHVGVYRYVVRENTAQRLGGIIYDPSVFCVTVTVTDEDGTLSAHTAVTDELGNEARICFRNRYQAAPASVSLSGLKKLNGMELRAEQFHFCLFEADESFRAYGPAVSVAHNDASGRFVFDLTCPKTGTFYYVAREDASDGIAGMTYDDTAYGIEITVWDDGSGILKAEVTTILADGFRTDALVFENSYTEPVEPTEPSEPTQPTVPSEPTQPTAPSEPTQPADPTRPSRPVVPAVPPTGDDSQLGLYVTLAVLSIAAIILLLVTGRKKKTPRNHRG